MSTLWTQREAVHFDIDSERFRLFVLNATADLGNSIARSLGMTPAEHEERSFEDGEHKSRPLSNVRGADVYVVQSTHGGPTESSNDKLCRLLFFIGALKDAGAARVTAVVPYLCYARKDGARRQRAKRRSEFPPPMFQWLRSSLALPRLRRRVCHGRNQTSNGPVEAFKQE